MSIFGEAVGSPKKKQIPPDLVVKFQTVDIAAVIGTLMGRQSSSPGCVATGNQGASCSTQPRSLGLPLNPLECGSAFNQDSVRKRSHGAVRTRVRRHLPYHPPRGL